MKTKIIIEIKLINNSSNQSNYILNYHLYIKSFEPQSNKELITKNLNQKTMRLFVTIEKKIFINYYIHNLEN